jgi:adenine-specific DNA-methyltransferase
MAGYTLDTITTGDARKLSKSLPDGSVDLVFADPIYQNIKDYAWLAKTSLRVLGPRGVVLAWASVPKAGRAQAAMERAGLEYVYTLFYTVVAKTYRMRWYNLFCWTTPCLWFQRPGEATRPNKWMPDTLQETIVLPPEILDNTVIATANPDDPFAWNKNTGVLRRWMGHFSRPGGVVWDPFAGSGSVPVVAKMLGRRCYASEIVPERAEEARARLAATPEPMDLSVSPAEQALMSLEEAA